VKRTPTISVADQKKGYAGGGLWSTPAYDPKAKYLYWGAANPNSKTIEHDHTNAILKIDLNRRHRTFGAIVDSYKGDVDQYREELIALRQTPACEKTDFEGGPYQFGDPLCGELDLGFGASPNLFRLKDGTQVVGDLEKSGVYHVARTKDMERKWTALVSPVCQLCNFASPAFDGESIAVVGTPLSTMWSLNRDNGKANWASPVGDVLHLQGSTAASGVVWTVTGNADLVAWEAKTGKRLMHRPMLQDTNQFVPNGTSGGIAIAEHTLIASAGGFGNYTDTPGWLIAYRVGG
jgi:outer membrane protein assembly factor BamB